MAILQQQLANMRGGQANTSHAEASLQVESREAAGWLGWRKFVGGLWEGGGGLAAFHKM